MPGAFPVFSVLKGPSADRHLCSHGPSAAVAKVPMDHPPAPSLAAAFQSRDLITDCSTCDPVVGVSHSRNHQTTAILAGIGYSCLEMFQSPAAPVFLGLFVCFFSTDAGCY